MQYDRDCFPHIKSAALKEPPAPTRNAVSENAVSVNTALSENMPESPEQPDFLTGETGDALEPCQREIIQVYHNSLGAWQVLLQTAEKLGNTNFPPCIPNIQIMLQGVPALPNIIAEKWHLMGQALWSISGTTTGIEQKESRPKPGPWKNFRLAYEEPLSCLPKSRESQEMQPRGCLLLVFCWSYILSVRLLELQKRQVSYTGEFRNISAPLRISGVLSS
jgi:hypothetical protein